MSHLMRKRTLVSCSSRSFKHACATSEKVQKCYFLPDCSSTSLYCGSEQRRLWRDCADAQARLSPSLVAYVISTFFTWAGSLFDLRSFDFFFKFLILNLISLKMVILNDLFQVNLFSFFFFFLAHLSRRLARWAYRIGVEPASVCACVCVCACVRVSVNNFKHEYL